jgi:TonB family protein
MMNWSFWVELLVRSGILLLAGEGLRRVGSSQSPEFRHRLLAWVFVLLAALPMLAFVFAEIPLYLPANGGSVGVAIQEGSWRAVQSSASGTANFAAWVWLAGFFVALGPLLFGAIKTFQTARKSRPIQNSELRDFANALAGQTPVLIAKDLRIPLVCGFMLPRILLPRAAEEWTCSRLEAVLLHELAHVRRRDLLVQIFAHLVSALWWFQPLVWILRRQLRSESEFACDAEALGNGYRASRYAEELLAVARSASQHCQISTAAIGMASSKDLEQRLKMILQPQIAIVRPVKSYLLIFVLGVASVGASALSLDSENQGGSMKHVLISALLTSSGLTAGTVGGYIHDVKGVPVADAKVTIYNPATSTKQELTTAPDGSFNLTSGDAGHYILRAEKPGFLSIFRAFDLKADSTVARDFTMPTEGGTAVADKSLAPAEAEENPIRVGGQVAQSNLLVKVAPIYPASAKQARLQGTVEIATTISKEGVPVDLRVISSPGDDLSESSLEAVSQWRYRPTLLNGNPVEVLTTVIINYTLSQ